MAGVMEPDDPRPIELREEMAAHFHNHEADYRDGGWCEIVFEDEGVVVIADKTSTGCEFGTWIDHDVTPSAEEFSRMMYTVAKCCTDYRFNDSYPVVFDKFERA